MGAPAAKQGDKVVAVDTHIVMVPSAGGPMPTPLPHPFDGTLDGGLVATVEIAGSAAAVVGTTASNQPHTPTPPGVQFQAPPLDSATVIAGSATVLLGGQAAARSGDSAQTCGEPPGAGTIIASGTVLVGS